jgi:hypothetical protein
MGSLVGTWRLVSESARDANGQPQPTLFGPMPIGVATFTAAGRMMYVISDGRPDPIDGTRSYASSCGRFSFDGSRLVYHVDRSADPDLLGSAQVRDARFDGNRVFLRPPVGFGGASDVTRELVWERIA